MLSLVYFQDAGGAEVDLSAAQGSYTQFTPGAFQLVGDTADGGLAVDSVPGSNSSLTHRDECRVRHAEHQLERLCSHPLYGRQPGRLQPA